MTRNEADMSRDQWTIEQWREHTQALELENQALAADYCRAVEQLSQANTVAAEAVALAKKNAAIVKVARLIEHRLAQKLLVFKIKPPRKKAGRKPLLTLKVARDLVRYANQFKTSQEAAVSLAAEQVLREGLNPERARTRMAQVTGTFETKISKARGICRDADLRIARDYGLASVVRSPSTDEQISHHGNVDSLFS